MVGNLNALTDEISRVCPVDGLSADGAGAVTIQFRPEATQKQRAAAAAILAVADMRPRRPRPLASIVADLTALPAGDLNRLRLLAVARLIQQEPGFARMAGVAIDGDEPDA